MIDHHDRPDEIHPIPANDGAGAADALDRDDIQQAQDQAGIAGEPQPSGNEPSDTEGEQAEGSNDPIV